MPLNSNSTEAKSRRPAGQLPNVQREFDDAMRALENLSPSLREMLKPVLNPILSAGREQHRLNFMLWNRTDALPGLHANTHLGNTDNLVSGEDPEPITLTADADPGDPHEGVSARGHVHPVGDDLAALIPFGEVTTEVLNDYDVLYVYDPEVEMLLQRILLELLKMTEAL